MSPFLRFYPAFILFPCPCLSPSTTLDPYTHLSLVVGSHEPLLHPCMVGPSVSCSKGQESPFLQLAVPFPVSPRNFSWAWKLLPPGTTLILREA